MVITSPPYNEDKKYGDIPGSDLSPWKDYIPLMRTVFTEAKRVLVPGGRVAVNIANLGRFNETRGTYYKPLKSLFEEILLNLDLIYLGEIVWWKSTSANIKTAWGSFLSPRAPSLQDTHEYIIIFRKEGEFPIPREYENNPKIIPQPRFMKLIKSIWNIAARRNKSHPCVFPDQLVDNLLTLYTFPGQTVLDPFGGSGTTARVAKQLGRNSISFEVVPRFQKMIEIEIGKTFIQDWFEGLDNE
jgi:site-specific DNA-methyltransferase (adenine-specific)